MRFALSDVAGIVGGELLGADVAVDGVSTDSRTLTAGELFVPLIAERDGHEFIVAAIEAGAAACLARRDRLGDLHPPGVPLVVVTDTGIALGALGAAARARFEGRIDFTVHAGHKR